ncbi:hypothetical protein BKA64DRAFT_26528 [Cadophora sp. MPI-SDFR-AT-0126]|nr:hypothetical protein BKA64DRAFT_26528 [Leotiomycetes sp. MPI-SDFR-AT-0126]
MRNHPLLSTISFSSFILFSLDHRILPIASASTNSLDTALTAFIAFSSPTASIPIPMISNPAYSIQPVSPPNFTFSDFTNQHAQMPRIEMKPTIPRKRHLVCLGTTPPHPPYLSHTSIHTEFRKFNPAYRKEKSIPSNPSFFIPKSQHQNGD